MRFSICDDRQQLLELFDDITRVKYLRDNEQTIIGLEFLSRCGPEYNFALVPAATLPDDFDCSIAARNLLQAIHDQETDADPSTISHSHGVERSFVLTLSNQIVIADPNEYKRLISQKS